MKRHNISPDSYRGILPDIVQEAQDGAPESVRDFAKQLLTQVGNVLATKVENDLRNFDLSSKEDVDTYCRIVENYIEKARYECLGRVVDVCPREDWESVWKKFSDGLLIVRQTVRDSLYTSLGVRLDLKTSLESGGFEAGKEKSAEIDPSWVSYLEDEVERLEAELGEVHTAFSEKDVEIENIRNRLFDAESRISSLVRDREDVEKSSALPEAVSIGTDSKKTDQERAVDVLTGHIEQFSKQYKQVEDSIGKWQEMEDEIIAFREDIESYIRPLNEKKFDIELRLRIISEDNVSLLRQLRTEIGQVQERIREFDSLFVAIGENMEVVQKEMKFLGQKYASLRVLLQTLHTARATLMSVDGKEDESFSSGSSVSLLGDRLQDLYREFSTIRDGNTGPVSDANFHSEEKTDSFGIAEGESFIAAKQVEEALLALRHTDFSELEKFFPVEYFGFDKEYAKKVREDFLFDIQKSEYPLRVKTLCALLLSAEDGGVKMGLPTDVLGAFTRRNDAKKVFSTIGINSGSDIGGKLLMQLSILGKHTSDLRVVRREQGGFQRSEGGRTTQTNFLTVYGRAAAEHWKQELLETGLVSQHFFEVFQSAVNDFKQKHSLK